MEPADIEAIERATIAAVSPQTVEELPEGWLLPFDSGTVSRAKTALPLRHLAPGPGLVERIEARYHARGLPPAFRLPDAPCFDAMREALAHRGYGACKATVTQIGHAQAMGALAADAPAEVDAAPDAGWESVFLGPGFDPVDGASRVRALSRASGTLFASVREDGRTVAAGAIAFGHGWASVHGMRTEQAARGHGLAGRVLAGLAQAALARGVERVFLQVEAGNAPALSLYRRAGFSPAWRYAYWLPA
ncbi:GNAT family N-acetyltransferase [Variovorax sp. J22G21]|uniref:GNAT family N-acetyltransferase n=1 Tax=Variovorax fucosicus TaxID=3053517 RepID=UPI002577897E|nr:MULTISPECIES: GNAT family N-acetyltransferase [unclassified Variovorax]MDM0039270.1 GNAT family N-acetyltransferase [Variovorax sp. J22R193]MDM0064046.1 GNAT family N-acetyltransferase [Variovorax sp. J22G21]